MSDTDSDSEVQINIRPNRNNIIRDESLDEGSNYESQNEQDFEQPSLSNANADVSSPFDPVHINTSQSEPSDTVARVPRSQGSATSVDIPGRRSPFNVGIPDQHVNATQPRVDIPGRRSPFNVGIPDQHSNVTQPRVDIPGRRSPFNVGIPDQHSNATHPWVDIPGRRSPFNVGIPDQHSNATHTRVDIPGRRSTLFNVGNPDKHSSATQPWVDIPGRRQTSQASHVDIQDQHSSAIYPRVDSPSRRQSLSEFGVDHRDRYNRDPFNVCSPDRRFRVPDSISHDRDDYSHPSSRRFDVLGRRRRSPSFKVSFQEQHRHCPDISIHHQGRNSDESRYHKNDMARRSRASNRYEPADSRDFGPRFGYRDSRSISAATRRTYSRDRVSPGPVRHTRSPSPHYNRPIRRSRAQIRRSSDPRKRYFSPYGRRHKSFDYERPLQNPERGDINQSNKISMLIPHGRPDYRECSTQRSCPDLEPYTNDPYESVSDYEQRRPWTEFDDEHVHYTSSCQSGPRIKPESFSGNEDWEEYQSHFEDCAELSRWDHRSKILFLAASLKGQARTYYMSLEAHDKRSYSALVFKMKQRFGCSQHAVKWLNQLELRQRKSGESITALGEELRQLAKKAYRHLDTNAQETLALNQLYKLIPVEMKCRCIDHDCQSVHQAVEVIERYEAILGESSQERKKSSLRSMDHKTEAKNNDPSKSGILQKLDARLEKLETLSLVQQIAGREDTAKQQWKPAPSVNRNNRCCFFCSSPDHMVKNCPEKSRQGLKPRYPGPPNGAFQGYRAPRNDGAFQGNRAPQNGAWQSPQQLPQPLFPAPNTSQQQVPLQLPQFNFPPPMSRETPLCRPSRS